MVYDLTEHKKKLYLINKAMLVSKKFRYPDNCTKLEDCFTKHEGRLVFWFTTDDDSTHAVVEEAQQTAFS